MTMTTNRLDASLLTEEERALLQPLLDLAERNKHPSLKGADGTEIRLPEPIYQLLVRVLMDMRHGRAIVLMPEEETFTSQAAANFLGMSRQYLVSLLDRGLIPHHRVGTHRRVYFKDLRDYAKKRDKERRSGLNRLFKEVKAAGKYQGGYTGRNDG
jgi:excisionase family DNA binding protein